jgi:hypothetical protein
VIQAFGEFKKEREISISVFIDENQNGGIQKFMIDEIENMPDDLEIYIKDYYNDGATYNIKGNSGFEISLESGEHKDRFALVFQSKLEVLGETESVKDEVFIFMNNSLSEINIHKIAELDLEQITLFNILGQQMKVWKKGLTGRDIQLPVNMSAGVYIVNLQTKQGVISKKVLIE